jgi:hypothetical protein
MEAVGIPQLEAATEAGLTQVATDLTAGESTNAAVADTAATALITLGTDAKADINALYTYIGMRITGKHFFGEILLSTILVIAAFILFVIAAFPVASRINLVAAGLACWVLSTLVGSGLLH